MFWFHCICCCSFLHAVQYAVIENSTQLSYVHSFPIANPNISFNVFFYVAIRFQKIICHKYSEIILLKRRASWKGERGRKYIRFFTRILFLSLSRFPVEIVFSQIRFAFIEDEFGEPKNQNAKNCAYKSDSTSHKSAETSTVVQRCESEKPSLRFQKRCRGSVEPNILPFYSYSYRAKNVNRNVMMTKSVRE